MPRVASVASVARRDVSASATRNAQRATRQASARGAGNENTTECRGRFNVLRHLRDPTCVPSVLPDVAILPSCAIYCRQKFKLNSANHQCKFLLTDTCERIERCRRKKFSKFFLFTLNNVDFFSIRVISTTLV